MFAPFCEVFNARNYLLNSLRANYENFDRMKDRKMIKIFYASYTNAIGFHLQM